MKLLKLIFLFIIANYSILQAQETIQTIDFASEHLKENRKIHIYLPPQYETATTKEFSVLYVLDGQEYFYFPIAYQNMLRFKEKSPSFIVVGINSDRQKRRVLYNAEANSFMSFLQQELIPFIDANFRTLEEKERLYFGWEMAGGLALDLFNQSPSLFSAYFIASPTHFSDKRLNALNEKLALDSGNNTFFYITRANAKDDEFMINRFTQLKTMLKEKSPKNTTWVFDLLDRDNHYSTPSKTIHNGLQQYFNDYNPLRFFSLKDYRDFGEMPAINKYYTNRSERYQVSFEIHRETKHFLFLQALKDDNYNQFNFFAETFPNHLKYNLSNDFWVNRFAEFYMKHNHADKAIILYNDYINRFSESARLYHGLGNAYKKNGETKKAKTAYKKAVDLAKSQGDSNYDVYLQSLENM